MLVLLSKRHDGANPIFSQHVLALELLRLSVSKLITEEIIAVLPSHSQFRLQNNLYLDLHGLVFETSIYHWQDQPGSDCSQCVTSSSGSQTIRFLSTSPHERCDFHDDSVIPTITVIFTNQSGSNLERDRTDRSVFAVFVFQPSNTLSTPRLPIGLQKRGYQFWRMKSVK